MLGLSITLSLTLRNGPKARSSSGPKCRWQAEGAGDGVGDGEGEGESYVKAYAIWSPVLIHTLSKPLSQAEDGTDLTLICGTPCRPRSDGMT